MGVTKDEFCGIVEVSQSSSRIVKELQEIVHVGSQSNEEIGKQTDQKEDMRYKERECKDRGRDARHTV